MFNDTNTPTKPFPVITTGVHVIGLQSLTGSTKTTLVPLRYFKNNIYPRLVAPSAADLYNFICCSASSVLFCSVLLQ